MAFDRAHGVDSVFFFGMNQGLGMSYRPDEARPMIQKVKDGGFLVGVHGIEYTDAEKIKKEKDTFTSLMGFEPDGIRMHYVRFDENTFENIAKAGYAFDSTEFDKPNNGTVKAPYTPDVRILKDRWTVVTTDGALSAHYENTVLITDGEPEILTVTEGL